MTTPVDLVIEDALLWPGPGEPLQSGCALWISNGRIAGLGKGHPAPAARARLQARGALLMPGLVQTHIHLCQTLFRGAAEELALLPWLRRFIWPLEAAHDEASIRTSALLTCAELIRGGTTSFLSFETVRHTATAMAAVEESGLRGILSHCLMDASGGYPPLAVSWKDARAECDALRSQAQSQPRLGLALAPRFVLSCSHTMLSEAAAYARAHGLLLHTHACEQHAEIAEVMQLTGMSNIEYLHHLGLTGPDVCLAHCVHTTPKERALLAETDTRVLHCPSANLKLGSGIAPVPEYLRAGLTVSLGADGAPCNNRLDGFSEMRMAALIQKGRLGPRCMPPETVLAMATEHGARTLRKEAEIGRLAVGRPADLLLVDRDGPHVLPSGNALADLVHAHQSADVRLVMVAGRILFRDGHLTTIDEERLRSEAREQRQRVFRSAGLAA